MESYPKNKIRILLLENIHQDAFQLFSNDGFDVELLPGAMSPEELIHKIKEVHILGIRSKTNIPKQVIENGKKLLSIGCFCIGTDQVDLKTAEQCGIPVFNAPYSNTRSVAELVIGLIIMLSRKVSDHIQNTHKGVWNKISDGCFEVRGKTLGIIGYGNIGSQVSILAEALGLKTIFYDIQTKLPIGNATPRSSYEEILKEADFITFHVPENQDTFQLLTDEKLKITKKGSYIINLARGKVVDLDALKKYLQSGHIAGAAIDVYPVEPKTNNAKFESPLQGLPNVILTPHIGGSTEEAQKNIGTEVALKLIRYINNGSTSFSVNFPNIELSDLPENCTRILNIHKNQPGFLKDINSLISDINGNILSQTLSTSNDIGYLNMIIDQKSIGDELKEKISQHKLSIKTRILY